MEIIKNIKLPDGNTYKIGGGLDDKITNCITEIPQDIKLELKDGVPTLKAGSKVIVPNGFEADGTTPKFDEVVIESDISLSLAWGSTNVKMFLFYGKDDNRLSRMEIQRCVSGATNPYTSAYAHFWYDTSSNVIHNFAKDGSLLGTNFSLPLCIYTAFGKDANGNDSPKAVSIDQPFNGFGYIGSTVFVLPNVKGLVPNGRNEDGTLNNIEYTTDKVVMETYGSTINADTYRYLVAETSITGEILGGSTFWSLTSEYINSSVQPPTKNYTLWYDTKNNVHKRCINSEWHIVKVVKFAEEVITSGQITSFTPKLPFRAVDYNDKSEISGWGMPSGKYVNLTLNASGATYTAPANGWVFIDMKTTTNNNRAYGLVNNLTALRSIVRSNVSGVTLAVFLPAKKGDVFHALYEDPVTANYFRFIYAEGEV